MRRLILITLPLLLTLSCGVNFFKPIEGKNPSDELERLSRQSNKDPEKNLRDAKNKLDQGVQDALLGIENLVSSGTAYKDLTSGQLSELREAIPQSVRDAFVGDDLESAEKKEILQDYSDVMLAYSRTTDYSEIDFLDVLLETAGTTRNTENPDGEQEEDGNDDEGANFTLVPNDCPAGVDIFIKVAGEMRKKYCHDRALLKLENLEISAFIGELIYTIEQEDTSYEYSQVIEDLKKEIPENFVKLIERDNFATYLQSLFLQVTYAACELVTDDCTVDTSTVSPGGIKRLWQNLQLSLSFEKALKESGLLPDLRFSAKSIVDNVVEDSLDNPGCEDFGDEPVLCTLLQYFRDVGANCQSLSAKPGECESKSP